MPTPALPELTRRQVLAGLSALAAPALLRAPPRPPQVTTGAASSVGQAGATLNGTVNPRGLATVARFEWGLTTAYGNATPDASVGSGKTAVPFARAVTGLLPGRLYHFRLRATNSAGTTLGADVTFATTAAGKPAFTIGRSHLGGDDVLGGTL